MRPPLEVADIFRAAGPAWRAAHAGHISLAQLKVMSAIETCRTAALGGHIEGCEECGHRRIAYNSCLMGKFRNGELARGRGGILRLNHGRALHYDLALSIAISLSGGRKDPFRKCGGTMACMASSFSVGSPRV